MGRLVPMLVILLMMGTRPATAELSFAGAGSDYCSLVNSNATPGRDSSQNITTMMIFTWAQGYLSGMNGMLLNLKSVTTVAATFDLQAISTEQQWAYIVAYCRANPSAAIVTAVMDLAGKHLMRPSR